MNPGFSSCALRPAHITWLPHPFGAFCRKGGNLSPLQRAGYASPSRKTGDRMQTFVAQPASAGERTASRRPILPAPSAGRTGNPLSTPHFPFSAPIPLIPNPPFLCWLLQVNSPKSLHSYTGKKRHEPNASHNTRKLAPTQGFPSPSRRFPRNALITLYF
jgi:hypothetical protein